MDRHALEREIDQNLVMFERALPGLLHDRAGEYVLIRHREMVDFFGSMTDALRSGRSRFADGIFSVQEVTDRPIDLGLFSHAVHPRIA